MKRIKNKKAFSLIEVVVVMAVVALVVPAIFSIVFAVLKQQVKLYHMTELKRQGDTILNILQTHIKPAYGIYDVSSIPLCAAPNYLPLDQNGINNFYKSDLNDYSSIYLNGTVLNFSKIATIGGIPQITGLTNSHTVMTKYLVSCARANSYAPVVVTINYTIGYGKTLSPTETLTYRTKIVVRNN